MHNIESARRAIPADGRQSYAELHAETSSWLLAFFDAGADEDGEFRPAEAT